MIIENIKDFPSKQAEELQRQLIELDKQGKLKEKALSDYKDNLGKENSLIRYILKNWEDNGKKLYMEYTGIETFDDKQTVKRAGAKLNEMTYGSGRYFLWKCSKCQYEWVATVVNRTGKNMQGCPACNKSINTIIKGVNDLETYCKEHPELSYILEEFVGEDLKGNKILPSEISRASNKDVWWKCSKCGHEWISNIVNRTAKIKRGCPVCRHIKVEEANHKRGETLAHWCNRQARYGDRIKQEFIGLTADGTPIKIEEISKGSNDKVWWKCSKCEYKWASSPNDRTCKKKSGCPHCAANTWTSFPEQYIYQSLKQLFDKILNRAKTKDTHYEYDIAIQELNLCIEYSGYAWHQDRLDRDELKEAYCKSKGINFLQIYAHQGDIIEPDTYTKEKIVYRVEKDKSKHIKQLQYIIKFILKEYNSGALYDKIDFKLAEQQANKVMGKA